MENSRTNSKIGPTCIEFNIFKETLYRQCEYKKDQQITRGAIYEIEKFRRDKGVIWTEAKLWAENPFSECFSLGALVNSWNRIYSNAVTCRRNHKTKKLKEMLKDRDERLNESSELQRFLQNLDHFQVGD